MARAHFCVVLSPCFLVSSQNLTIWLPKTSLLLSLLFYNFMGHGISQYLKY